MLACLWKRQKKEELITIGYFRVPRASVSKRGWVVILWYDNDFSFSCKESHFHKKGCALALILKVRVFATHKWPIFHRHSIVLCNKGYPRHSWILDSTLWIADCSTVKIGFQFQSLVRFCFLDHEFHKQRFLSLWNLDYLKWDELKEIKFDTNWWINSLIIDESNSMLQPHE